MILQVVLPIFIVLAIGILLSKLGVLAQSQTDGLSKLVFYVGFPASLFEAIALRSDAGEARHMVVAAAYFIPCLFLFFLSYVLSRSLFRRERQSASIFALNACFSNSVMMGVPLVNAAYGPSSLPVLASIISLHSAILLPLATILIETGKQSSTLPRQALVAGVTSLIQNPIVVSIAIGIGWSFLGWSVPGLAISVVHLLSSAATPCALIALGGSLASQAAAADVATESIVASLIKLICLPGSVLLSSEMFHLAPLETSVALLIAATPTGANAFVLAARYGRSSGVVAISTVVSLVTLPVVIVLSPSQATEGATLSNYVVSALRSAGLF
ncbi:AEC family transporter [Bradyrhizobium elkanii]|uniref:AEC family transporter n=1 Tax=Bradyrhizobium elkanii TaxID=29448 RepID=UPI00209F8F51|nr:AEC family transporter [Bradyrhizobium elkanii]MCP1968234.1 putative permease [Bradyrhizobium elkanii]MCS4110266.1 putative permease [Bradyrhizobium elkanii]